ncbi:MAG: helix-turn-helix transcriptional regulator [Pseudomonadota bacterium]
MGLARDLGVTHSFISNWESGRSRPNLAIADRICVRFRVPLDWLFLGRRDYLTVETVRRLENQAGADPGSDRD